MQNQEIMKKYESIMNACFDPFGFKSGVVHTIVWDGRKISFEVSGNGYSFRVLSVD